MQTRDAFSYNIISLTGAKRNVFPIDNGNSRVTRFEGKRKSAAKKIYPLRIIQ